MHNEKKTIPNAPIPVPPTTSGNILSNIAPPVELPSFVTVPAVVQPSQPAVLPQVTTQQNLEDVKPSATQVSKENMEQFRPAIPLSMAEPTLPLHSPDGSQSPVSLTESFSDVDKLGDVMPGSGLLTWVKGAVSSGGILHKVAEKAKSSVDSMITTLDPQMKDYLNGGGDIQIVVASDKEVKISPVKEAFQSVLGKTTVVGIASESDVVQPIGYASAYASAKQRIAHIRTTRPDINNNVPIVAIESFLHEAIEDRWYDISLLILSQPSLGIELQVQSQGTPVPHTVVTALNDSEEGNTTVGAIMADSLKVPHTQWQEATTGVPRKDILVLAAKSLAGSYKMLLAVSADQC